MRVLKTFAFLLIVVLRAMLAVDAFTKPRLGSQSVLVGQFLLGMGIAGDVEACSRFPTP